MSVHVRRADGSRFGSKKALQEAVAAGEPVTIVDESPTGNRSRLKLTDLTELDVIAGAYSRPAVRTWYAIYKDGKIV